MEQPNLSYIKNMSGGDRAFEKKLINIIKNEFPEEKQRYYEHLSVKNYEQVSQIVHKLKHKISILGLKKSYYLASNFEANLLEGNDNLHNEFEFILDSITHFLKQF